MPVPESLQHIPQWTLYLGGVTSTLLLDSSLAKSSVMTGQRRVDPSAVRCLIDRIKQAKVSGQKQEYQRQGRDVNNTRQKSGHRHRFRVPRSGSPGSNTEITNSRMNNAQKCQPGQELTNEC